MANPGPGTTGTVVLQVVNKGIIDVKFVTVSLQQGPYDLLSPSDIYLGDIESDDFETAEYKVHVREGKEVPFSFLVTYMDANNNPVRATMTRTIPLYSTEQARSLGLAEGPPTAWYVTGGIVIIGLALYLFFRRKR